MSRADEILKSLNEGASSGFMVYPHTDESGAKRQFEKAHKEDPEGWGTFTGINFDWKKDFTDQRKAEDYILDHDTKWSKCLAVRFTGHYKGFRTNGNIDGWLIGGWMAE